MIDGPELHDEDFPAVTILTDAATAAGLDALGAGVPLCQRLTWGHYRPEHPGDAGCASCGCLAYVPPGSADLRIPWSGFARTDFPIRRKTFLGAFVL